MSFSGAYSSDSHHARAAAVSGNSISTMRCVGHSPSSSVESPPRIRKRPPWLATASVLRRRYSISASWSRTARTSAIT